MGVPKEQATRNRRAIIDVASRIFRERGVDGVGVADLMKEAGFTHGGFYNHFASKDALAAEACADAFAIGDASMRSIVDADLNGEAGAFRALMERYLSPKQCGTPGEACPTAGLAIDAARQGLAMQTAYADGIETFIQTMTRYFAAHPEGTDNPRKAAIAMLATMIGGIVMARGIGGAQPALAEEILGVCREELKA